MNAWEIIFGWKSGNCPPSKDGRYYVAVLRQPTGRLDIDTLDYTVEYGWNTDQTNTDHAISYTGADMFWTPALRLSVEEITFEEVI